MQCHCYGNGFSNTAHRPSTRTRSRFHTGWGAVFEYKVFSTPAAGTLGTSPPGLVRQYGSATYRGGYTPAAHNSSATATAMAIKIQLTGHQPVQGVVSTPVGAPSLSTTFSVLLRPGALGTSPPGLVRQYGSTTYRGGYFASGHQPVRGDVLHWLERRL